MKASWAARTHSSQRTMMDHWGRYRTARALSPALLDRTEGQHTFDVAVAGFQVYLWDEVRIPAPGTIATYVSLLRSLHAAREGWTKPEMESPLAERVLKGIRKLSSHVVRRSSALLTGALVAFTQAGAAAKATARTAPGTPLQQERVLYAATITAMAGLLRLSEYAETTVEGRRSFLRRKHVHFDGTSVVLTLERAKTSYILGRELQTARIGSSRYPNFDVPSLLREMLDARPDLGPEDPVFPDLARPGHAISREAMTAFVRKVACVSGAAAALGPSALWTPHGLRAGGAVMLRCAGYSDAEIMRAGRWTSMSFCVYEVGEKERAEMRAGRIFGVMPIELAVTR